MSIFSLILAAMLLGNLIWWRWADRYVKKLAYRQTWRTLLSIYVSSQLAYLMYSVLGQRSAWRSHTWMPIPVITWFYIWNLLVIPTALVVTGIAKIGIAAKRLLTKQSRAVSARSSSATDSTPPPPEKSLTRRQALSLFAVTAPPLVTALAVGRAYPQLEEFRIRSFDLNIPSLPPNLNGLRIAHLSDTHIGRYTRPKTLPRIIEAVNQLKADIVVFTGDLIDLSLDDLPRGIDALKQLDPRHGFAMIEGNHDLIDNPNEFDRRTLAAGLPLLLDQSMTIPIKGERLQLLGTRWGVANGERRRAGEPAFRASIAKLIPQRETGAFPIVLAHHPHTFDAGAAAGFPLMLSGHTHGGQLMLTDEIGFGPAMFRYWSGLYRKDASQLIVSNGVGNWFPLRVNAPAEIVHITLHSA